MIQPPQKKQGDQGSPDLDAQGVLARADESLDLQILLKDTNELDEQSKTKQSDLIKLFRQTPLYTFLPDKPVKQAYFIMLLSMIGSFGIWFIS